MSQKKELYCSAIIVAAGKGKRMKSDISKQFINIKNKPVLAYTLECFDKCTQIKDIILVVAEEYIDYCSNEIIYKYNFNKNIIITAGGKERQNSVYNGLKKVSSDTDIVLIHDGVRPFIEMSYIQKVICSAYENKGCVLGVPVKDTIKICSQEGFIETTPRREKLWAIQTPQAFDYNILMEAYKKSIEDNFIGTDDAMLVERLGYKIKIEQGSYKNIKITTPEDLITAEIIMANI